MNFRSIIYFVFITTIIAVSPFAVPRVNAVTITPSVPPVVNGGGTFQFLANPTATWSLAPGSQGTIDTNGLYHAPASLTASQSIGGCQLLPQNSIYNTRIDSLPVDPSSSHWIDLVTQFGPRGMMYGASFPTNYIDVNTPSVNMSFRYTPGQNGFFQIPQFSVLKNEGGPYVLQNSGDHHIITIRPDNCDIQELYQYYQPNPADKCPTCNSQSASKYNAMTGGLPVGGGTDAAAAFLSPMVLRVSEVDRALATGGSINHALRTTLKNFSQLGGSFLWPAISYAVNCGTSSGVTNCVPYGARFRLKSSYVYHGSNPATALLIQQLKQYGLIVVDGSTFDWQITMDADVSPSAQLSAALSELSNLTDIPSNFEVVDESGLDPYPGTNHAQPDAGLVKVNNGIYTPPVYAAVVATDQVTGAQDTKQILLKGVAIDIPVGQYVVKAGSAPVQIMANISGTSNTSLAWSLSPAGYGSISQSGFYTPPVTLSNVSAPVVLTVTATSNANPNAFGVGRIVVLPQGDQTRLIIGSKNNYTDPQGNLWLGAGPGSTISLPVIADGYSYIDSGSSPLYTPDIHARGDIFMPLYLSNGNYKATLKMNSLGQPGDYRQNIESQSTIIYHDFDVAAQTNGQGKPVDIDVPLQVTNGQALVTIRHEKGNQGDAVSGYIGSLLIQPDNTSPSIAIERNTQNVAVISVGQTRQFYVQGWYMSNQITWSVTAGPGTINSSGLYTAPASSPSADTTITVMAKSVVDPTKTDTVSFTFVAGNITVTPNNISINRQIPQQFSATIGGVSYTNIIWSATSPVGTIDSTGLYTPPTSLSADTIVTITARDALGLSQPTSITITVKANPDPIRINAGGNAFTDSHGNKWSADYGSVGDSRTYGLGVPIAGADSSMQPLYQSSRYFYQASTFYYQFPLPNGDYKVTLKWAEYRSTAEAFKINIIINGTTVLTNFDPVVAAGGVQKAYDKTFDTTVLNGIMRIDFVGQPGSGWVNPFINGIEIVPVVNSSSPSDTTPPTISAILTSNITNTSSTISWVTNESSDSQVEYGLTSSYGATTQIIPTLITSHSISLSSLTPNTLYHFRVKSKDASNNLSMSNDQTFSTSNSSSSSPSPTTSGGGGTSTPDPTIPIINSFTANPSGITKGQSSVLSWNILNITGASIDNGIGQLHSQSMSVSPTKTTEYTLTATKDSKSITAKVTIIVDGLPLNSSSSNNTTNTTITSGTDSDKITQLKAMIAELLKQVATLQAQLQAKLNGTTYVAGTGFTRDLTVGSKGEDVRALQVFLNTHGFPVTTTGEGSTGKETTYFGQSTRNALIKYQISQSIYPSSGYFGPITRGKVGP